MTVAVDEERNDYPGDGVTLEFDYSFEIYADTELAVYQTQDSTGIQTTKVLHVDYEVTRVLVPGGGKVQMVVAPPAGYTLSIQSNVAYKQSTRLKNQARYFPEVVERAVDRTVRMIKQLLAFQNRSAAVQASEVRTAPISIPPLVLRQNKFSAWDNNGDFMAATATPSTSPVSVYGAGLINAANKAAARTVLGFPLNDTEFSVVGSNDPTRVWRKELDFISDATTRVEYQVDEDCAAGQSWEAKGLKLDAVVAGNALNVTLSSKKGGVTDPMIFKFRHSTLANGGYETVKQDGALTVSLSSGSTIGSFAGQLLRLYIGVANDAGTARLFIYNPLKFGSATPTFSLLGVRPLIEENLHSSTAEGGAGAADSNQVIYSTVAFTNKPILLLGYIEISEAVVGTWATGPTKIHLLRPGDKKCGDIVQTLSVRDGETQNGTTLLPADNTIPQNTEGVQFMSNTWTPTSDRNLIDLDTMGVLANTAGNNLTWAVFSDQAGANALGAGMMNMQNVGGTVQPRARVTYQPGSVSTITFTCRGGGNIAGTTIFNGTTGPVRMLGGVFCSTFDVKEIFI